MRIRLLLIPLLAVALLTPVRAADDDAKKLSEAMAVLPKGTAHEHLMVPLRDGVKLATEVFLPEGAGPWPVVLMRTPYSRFDVKGRFEAMKGVEFAIVTQNARGCRGSEGAGTFDKESFDNEINDSSDAIDWVAKQKWCNGKVGMVGTSGHGMAAFNALWSGNPKLVAVATSISADNSFLHWSYHNGVRRSFYSWLGQREVKVTDWPKPTVSVFDDKAHRAFIGERGAKSQVAFSTNTGWYDLFSEAALDAFEVLGPNGKANVIIGNQGHGGIGGDLKYPSTPRPQVKERTFKQWMTEGPPPAAAPTKSNLIYYLMGDTRDPAAPGNVWKVAQAWPVPNTATPYYLQQDGTLSVDAPREKKGALTYDYDPRDPVKAEGGNFGTGVKNGPHDQRKLAERKDVLRFITPPLTEPVGITGKVRATLAISSDAPDTLFVVTLVDIYPDGYEAWVRSGPYMARYWQGLNKPAPIEKGKVYELDIDLWSTALVFNKGHRIGVYVSSSFAPGYEVHPNSYEPVMSLEKAPVARNTVHLSSEHASKIVLPVIPAASFAK
jgi:predicted acyl esterase